ncbi:MAG TPA: hypothetical protein PLF70_02805 [Candidatus Portnoybacteria bacterium]|nr:hypothetical protein [Candidatus Portnoybacteria bacterium]
MFLFFFLCWVMAFLASALGWIICLFFEVNVPFWVCLPCSVILMIFVYFSAKKDADMYKE